MQYKISICEKNLILTGTSDYRIHSLDLDETKKILDRIMTSQIMGIVIDFSELTNLSFRDSLTILLIVFQAKEYRKSVYFYNIQLSLEPILVETGILSMGKVLHSTEDFELAFHDLKQPSRNTSNSFMAQISLLSLWG